MRLSFLFILSALCVATSCKDHKKPAAPATEKQVKSMPEPAKKEIPKTSTFGKLQGKWQSTEDPKSFILFEGTTRTDIYLGEEPQAAPFKLAAGCNDERATYSEVKKLYLLSDDLCWSIDAVNSQILELTYMERGTILTYTKVVN